MERTDEAEGPRGVRVAKHPCPIRSVDLPGTPEVELRGLIVVVGPNSAGKTQFLHDLNEVVLGRARKLVVASALSLAPPKSFDEYFELLVRTGIIRESAPDHFLKRSLQFGADEGGGTFRRSQVQSQYAQFSRAAESKVTGTVPAYVFLKELGPLSCSALFLKNRLTLMDSCPTFDYLSQGPSKTLQSLYLSKDAKKSLFSEIARVFQRAVWVDNTRHGQLVLRVDDSTTLPSAEDRLEPAVMEGYRTIETEGDGLRSYTAICATLLLEQRALCLIDEPEMCLHPPQAYAMGRFIGEHASDEACTVVATHSSHVFRGVLEANPSAHVIRLTRTSKVFGARTLTPDLVTEATSKPRSRSEAILEGLLSHAVVLCEAESDRIVYETTYRTLSDRQLDIRFVPSEGTGGFADPLRLYRALSVPSAVIADLDFLAKADELRRVLTGLGVSDIPALTRRANELMARVRACLSPIDATQFQEQLRQIAERPIDVVADENEKLRGELLRMAKQLYRLRDLQERGVDAITDENLRGDVAGFLRELQAYGLFLVPVGELESWLPVIMSGIGRDDKSRWAMLAAQKIEEVGERAENVWNFVRAVYRYLCARLSIKTAVSDAS